MKSIDGLVRRIILGCVLLLLAPQILALLSHIVQDVVSHPPGEIHTGRASRADGFGAGVLVTFLGLILVVGLLARLGRALRNPESARYRAALDRRARTLPRYAAESDEVPVHSAGAAPADTDPELPWE